MEMSPSRRTSRGQAMVEMAIGSLVFITILLFVIHFAEVSFLSVKVTEAAHSAMLDAPGHKLHEWPNDSSPSSAAAERAGQDAAIRYRDFDSRTSTNGAGVITLALTQTAGMQVSCSQGGPTFDPHPVFTSVAYRDGGGISCTAQADLTAFRIPQRVAQQETGGFFQAEHYAMRPIRVCAMGRAQGGNCTGRLTSMLDDWGLTGSGESGSCPIIPDIPAPCPMNLPYWGMASSVYGVSLMVNAFGPDFSASRLAQTVVGGLPLPFFFGAENMFWMSAVGEEAFFGQPLPADSMGGLATMGYKGWPTSPGLLPPGLNWQAIPYPVSYGRRDSCFLGDECP
ncbi:TadE family protein [Myxococcus vastator]|uniref:TadE family protein n=1 Tax=Myxococcus vastator TaxID=2709664 RepID=UPI0013D22077|nr:TadE family protein [Myxococcus vastator]